jgi:SAM-dependent methyltransferase
MNVKNKLNLGCGWDIKEDCINLDCAALPGVDVVHDLTQLPLPFENETFVEVRCDNVLEHLEYPELVVDLHRILKPGGRLMIVVPHFTARQNFMDPTHKKMFSWKTFEFFVKGSKFNRCYYFNFPGFSKVIVARIRFEKRLFLYNYLVEPVINCSRSAKDVYEATFLSRLFPAANILTVLEK